MGKITVSEIAKIIRLEFEIFEEEDQDYPSRRVTAPKMRAIRRILNKVTKDIDKQNEIRTIISNGAWNTEDYTYRTICDYLRKTGIEVIEGVE